MLYVLTNVVQILLTVVADMDKTSEQRERKHLKTHSQCAPRNHQIAEYDIIYMVLQM